MLGAPPPSHMACPPLAPLMASLPPLLTPPRQVLCFDHNLRLMWERRVKMSFPHHAHIKEVGRAVCAGAVG